MADATEIKGVLAGIETLLKENIRLRDENRQLTAEVELLNQMCDLHKRNIAKMLNEYRNDMA